MTDENERSIEGLTELIEQADASAAATEHRLQFARQLATLDAHPERWVLVELHVLYSQRNCNNMLNNLNDRNMWGKVQQALGMCGIRGLDIDTARALLAAREAREEEG